MVRRVPWNRQIRVHRRPSMQMKSTSHIFLAAVSMRPRLVSHALIRRRTSQDRSVSDTPWIVRPYADIVSMSRCVGELDVYASGFVRGMCDDHTRVIGSTRASPGCIRSVSVVMAGAGGGSVAVDIFLRARARWLRV